MPKYNITFAFSTALLFGLPVGLLAEETQAPKLSTEKKEAKNHYYRSYYKHRSNKTDERLSDQEWDHIKKSVESMTPDNQSLISKKLEQMQEIQENPSGIAFYEPTYVLPYYNTTKVSPWYGQHPGNTPDHQRIDQEELKAKLSVIFPIWTNMFKAPVDFVLTYTQLNYWQVYSNSPYFRETNYEPQALITYTGIKNWLLTAGLDHESNGRGGVGYSGMERSWNRLFLNTAFSGEHWLISIMPWIPIYKTSQNLHNPNITKYIGYSRVVAAYNYSGQEISLMLRNTVESGFKRGAVELSYTFPLYGKLKGMVTVFSGYGQSLIEYDHYTNAYGIGVALSDWM
jgi:phospholipase A1